MTDQTSAPKPTPLASVIGSEKYAKSIPSNAPNAKCATTVSAAVAFAARVTGSGDR